jgi:amino acid permease
VYPLAIAKQVSALRYTSFLSFLAVVYLSLVVVIDFFILRSSELGSRFANVPAANVRRS